MWGAEEQTRPTRERKHCFCGSSDAHSNRPKNHFKRMCVVWLVRFEYIARGLVRPLAELFVCKRSKHNNNNIFSRVRPMNLFYKWLVWGKANSFERNTIFFNIVAITMLFLICNYCHKLTHERYSHCHFATWLELAASVSAYLFQMVLTSFH